jgi:hypothetical protein
MEMCPDHPRRAHHRLEPAPRGGYRPLASRSCVQPMLTSPHSLEAATRAVRVGVPTRRPEDHFFEEFLFRGVPALGSSPIMFTRTNGRRRVAVVRELAGDSHPIDVAGAVEGAIGGLARFGRCS